jgi:hypothetical protein
MTSIAYGLDIATAVAGTDQDSIRERRGVSP